MTSVRRISAAAVAGLACWAAIGPRAALANGPPPNTDNAFVNGLDGGAVRTVIRGMGMSGGTANAVGGMGAVMVPVELIPNRLDVGVALPLIARRLDLGASGVREGGGPGDVGLFSKVLLYQDDWPGGTTRVSLKGLASLPPGSTSVSDVVRVRVVNEADTTLFLRRTT